MMVCLVDCGILNGSLAEARVAAGINLTGIGDVDDLYTATNDHASKLIETILSECPEARFAVVRVMDDNGWLRTTDIVERAFEWILENLSALKPSVICAAFGDMFHYRNDDLFQESVLCEVIRELRMTGVLTVTAAGNMYPRFRHAQPHGMAWPAILRETVSVGAMATGDGGLKLDWSSQRLHASLGTGCATSVFAVPGPPGETSGAAAKVTGRLARLRLDHPNENADALLEKLIASMVLHEDDLMKLSWPILL